MSSEKKDFLSESGVMKRKGEGLFGFLKTAFLRRGAKVRDVNDFDAGELISRHNAVFGIDSSDPSASIRKDLRCIPPTSTVPLPKDDDVIIESVVAEAAQAPRSVRPVTVTVMSAQTHAVSATSSCGPAEIGTASYDSGADLDMGRYIDTTAESAPVDGELFTELAPRHEAVRKAEESVVEAIEAQIEADVAELGDVAAEEIAESAVEQIEGRETVQMTIDNPTFDTPECDVCAEPVIVRQDKLEVEIDVPVPEAEEVRTEIVEAAVSAGAVMEEVARTEAPVAAVPAEASDAGFSDVPEVFEDVPVPSAVTEAPCRPSGISFRFGGTAAPSGSTGVRFAFGTAAS